MNPFRLLLVAALIVVGLLSGSANPSLDDTTREACVLVTAQVRKAGFGMASATATGFFVAPGFVLTCHHMSRIPTPLGESPTTDYFVDTRTGHRMPARVVARDARNDLLLLKVSKPANVEPLPVVPFRLRAGDEVTIVGHFPDRYRISHGSVTREQVMPGFAMSSAKVRQGYSGGPVLDHEGRVQGILSQKDPWDNAVFAKSDAILALMQRAGVDRAPVGTPVGAEGGDSEGDTAAETAAVPETAQPLPRRGSARPVRAKDGQPAKVSASPRVASRAGGAADDDEMVVAVPVRRRAAVGSQ